MPNKTIYLNTINALEGGAGISLIDRDEVAQKLQEAWKKDTTQAKLDYLAVYREIFRAVLKKWSDNELSRVFEQRADAMPNFKQCLLKTDEALKLCAMAMIPELRENEDVLSHMTFGVIDSTKLKDEFVSVRQKYLNAKTSENVMKTRKANAYDKYKSKWMETTTRNITEIVRDKEALNLMSQDEKIDFALALESYRNDETLNRPWGANEKGLIDDSLNLWKAELGCENGENLDDFVAGQYYQYAQKFGNPEWLDAQVNDAIAEYNKDPNPAKQEIERYKKIDADEKELRKMKETTNSTAEITDDTAEMVGDFFMQEELTQELKEIPETPNYKTRVFLQEKVEKINKEYSLKLNHNKLRTSVEQLSAQMIKAREEKQRFLDKDSVVVIEKGVETCYNAKEYYKEMIDKANKTCFEEISKIQADRQREEEEYNKRIKNIENHSQFLDKTTIETLKADNVKSLKEKQEAFDKAIAKARAELQESLSAVKGGIVIEKNGDKERQYESKKYYETHETQKEQYAYGQYQQLYSRIYKDACKNIKEKNYPQGRITDFSHVAKDVEQLFKSAMYLSNVYDNDKNLEIVQKASYGGLSAERLAALTTYLDDDSWAKDQYRDDVWQKQSEAAKKIYADWEQAARKDKKTPPAIRIKQTLEKSLKSFNKGEITKKQLLDYMLAGEAHIQTNYPTNFKKLSSFIQYNRVNNALQKCRTALGFSDKYNIRIEMNLEYERLAGMMKKEQVFKAIEKRMDYSIGFKAEKLDFEQEHKVVRDKEIEQKTNELKRLKEMDKEPISIPELDERRRILNQQPRVKPVVPVAQQQLSLNANK